MRTAAVARQEFEFEAEKCPGCRTEIPLGVVICETCGVNVRTGKVPVKPASGYEESLDLWRIRIGDLFQLLFRKHEAQGGMDWGLLVMAYGLGGLIVMLALYLMMAPLIIMSSIPLLLMYYRVRIARTDSSTIRLHRTGLILPFGPSVEINPRDIDYMRIVIRVSPGGAANRCLLEMFGKSGEFKKLKVGVPWFYGSRDVDSVSAECRKFSRWLRHWTTVPSKIVLDEQSRIDAAMRVIGMVFLGVFTFVALTLLLVLVFAPKAG